MKAVGKDMMVGNYIVCGTVKIDTPFPVAPSSGIMLKSAS